MRIIKKKVVPALLVGAFAAAMVIPSYATSRRPIKFITLSIKANIVPGTGFGEEEIKTETSNSRFPVNGYDIPNDDFEWRDDSVPKTRIVLTADGDYCFQSLPKDKVTLKRGAQFLKTSRGDSSSALLMDVEPPSFFISIRDVENPRPSDNGIATWDPISAAGSYEVRVYRDDKAVGSAIVVNINTNNCRDRMIKGDTSYTVKVRVVSRFDGGEKGNWVDSVSVYVSSDQTAEFRNSLMDGSSAWVQPAENGRWWYDNGDGTYPANSWKQTGDKWYLSGTQGCMQTGWIQWEGKEYYCLESGDMLTNCMTADNYWVDEDGAETVQQCEVNDKS